MNEGRAHFSVGPLLAALGAIALAVALFLTWYGEDPGISGWTAFEVLDLLLFGMALVALAGAAARMGVGVPRGDGVGSALVPLAALALVVVGVQALNHPPAGIDREAGIGQWLALGGAAAMLVGAVLSSARISIAVSPREDTAIHDAPTQSTPADDAEL
jgi:hypothetical protein